MLSHGDAIDILKNLPLELVSLTFNYLRPINIIHFINDDFINDETDYLIKSLNSIPDELNIWNLIKNPNNKLFEWCKIMYYADYNNMYYKQIYDIFFVNGYKHIFSLPTNKLNRYIKKLYIGLYLNAGLNIYKAYEYVDIDINKITMIFNIMKECPQFNVEILYRTVKINKQLDTIENYITYANKVKQIYDITISTNNYISYDYLNNIVQKFSDKYFQRFISLLKLNVLFRASYQLSNPTRKFSDDLIDKFIQLKEELNINHELLVSNLRNNTVIKQMRLFKSKNISSVGIENLLNLDKDFLNYIINNNLIYDLPHYSWSQLKYIYNSNTDFIKEIFVKFSIKQQNNLRMKELSGDNSYNDLLKEYIIQNIRYYYEFLITNQNNTRINLLQFFQIYTELSIFHYNIFKKYITQYNFEEALEKTYQNIEY